MSWTTNFHKLPLFFIQRGYLPHGLELAVSVVWLFVHIIFLVGFRNRLAVLFQWALGLFYLQQRRALDYAKFPVRNAPAGVNEIKGLANQKISDPSNAEDLALTIQIVLQGKERGRLATASPGYLSYCYLASANAQRPWSLEAYLHDLTAPDGVRVDLLVHQPCLGYGARIDGDG